MKPLEAGLDVLVEVPFVLFDYLRTVLNENEAIYEVSLSSQELGAETIQRITCTTATGSDVRKVYGFSPVDLRMQVLHFSDCIEIFAV